MLGQYVKVRRLRTPSVVRFGLELCNKPGVKATACPRRASTGRECICSNALRTSSGSKARSPESGEGGLPCTPARREGGGSGNAELAAAMSVCDAEMMRSAPFCSVQSSTQSQNCMKICRGVSFQCCRQYSASTCPPCSCTCATRQALSSSGEWNGPTPGYLRPQRKNETVTGRETRCNQVGDTVDCCSPRVLRVDALALVPWIETDAVGSQQLPRHLLEDRVRNGLD